ncbi:SDR family NAD(P)-dependent oxidoreductase [Agrococcus carbonis]|uniref:NAD(P)-dependent dehydrogenase, short-chain alcohol dehydrogenase family n=1 Tax=Agrococcus carbonis TaxID=684552 RepID=A0A1H1NFS8_9MICO|nr:SDR family oxidoreductase [Agrococcus carbonis]SDR97843.1 NAD(P)-dependent dehydrogenase, short-chain alcohol dehydrogenase family [Agrococcus carbonis]
MNLGLEGRVAIVTGAGGGIGAATVRLLLAEGARVVAVERTPGAASALADEQGDRIAVLERDLLDDATPDEAVALAESRFGGLDILVNNAAAAPVRDGFAQTTPEDWRATLELNLLTPVRLCRAALPALADRGGVIVNVASTSGRYPEPMLVDYAASKAALLSLTGALATEYGPAGVRVLAVAPGPTRTPMWDAPGGFIDGIAARYGLEREAAVEHHIREVRGIALGRPGTADDIARTIVFAASDAAAHTSGTTLAVHGAMASHLM